MMKPADHTLLLSWERFHRDARILASLLTQRGPFRALVAITRGGLAPAAVIARELGLRTIETLSIASYEGGSLGPEDERRAPRILKWPSQDILAEHGAGVLVIDDLVDTGATARALRDLLPKAHFATLYAKPAGRALVDSYVMEVAQDTWINFPWDLGLAFQPPLASEKNWGAL